MYAYCGYLTTVLSRAYDRLESFLIFKSTLGGALHATQNVLVVLLFASKYYDLKYSGYMLLALINWSQTQQASIYAKNGKKISILDKVSSVKDLTIWNSSKADTMTGIFISIKFKDHISF